MYPHPFRTKESSLSYKELSYFTILSNTLAAHGRLTTVTIINTTKGSMQTVPHSSYDRLDYAVGDGMINGLKTTVV